MTLSSMALHKELLPSYIYAVDRNFPQGTFFGPQIFFFSSFIERNERGLVGLEGSEGEVVSEYKETTLATSVQFVFGSARDNITCRPDNS